MLKITSVQSLSLNIHAVISERLRSCYQTSTIGLNCPTVIPWEGQILVFGLSAKMQFEIFFFV
jgi:hypothetical protein